MKILLTEKELQIGVQKLAQQVNARFQDSPLTIIGVMTGSIVLLADLIRQLEMPLRVGVVQASSYSGTTRGDLIFNADLMLDVSDHHVLIVDDIFDTGHTLVKVIEQTQLLNPASVSSAVLLSKTGRQEVEMYPDYVAFQIPDRFVVGYGLDYDDEYRNLPYLAVLDEEEITRQRGVC